MGSTGGDSGESSLAAQMGRFARLIRVPVAQTPHDWGAANRVYAETTGMPGPRDPYVTPYMVPLSDAVASGRYSRAVAVTAAQSGKTDTELDIIGQRLDQNPVPILYVGPSKDFLTDQFEPRLRSMLTDCESLSDRFITGRREKKMIKIVGGVRVRLASGASSGALKSDQAGLAIVDEYDEMTGNIRGQGDPLTLTEARGETYSDFMTVITSTPGQGVVETEIDPVNGLTFWALGNPEEIASPIWRLFQEGTRYHWAWHCPSCGDPFIPMRSHLHWRPGSSPAEARRTAHLVCPHGCVIEDDKDGKVKAAMNASGFMIAPGQTIEDAKAGINGPDNSTYSQWSSGLTSPFVTWGKRAERLVQAEMSGEDGKKQTALNAGFGEIYMPGISDDMPDWRELLTHKVGLPPETVTGEMLRFAMGADVQKNGIYFVIRAFGSRGTSWNLRHGYLMGDTSGDAVWQDLAAVMMAPIDGFHIEKVLIDSGFRPDKVGAGSIHRVYDFCRQYSFIASPAKGRSTSGGRPYSVSKIDVKKDGSQKAFSIKLVMLDPDFFKSLVHTRVKIKPGQPGAFYLHDEADEEYARQVLSETRMVDPGAVKATWRRIRKDNHYLDCEALAAAAGYSMNVHSIPEGVSRHGEESPMPPAPVPPTPAPETPLSPTEPQLPPVKAEAGEDVVEVIEEAAPMAPLSTDSLRAKFSRLRSINRR